MLEYMFVKVACHSDLEGVAPARHHVREIASFVHGNSLDAITSSSNGERLPVEKQPQVLRLRCAPLRMTSVVGGEFVREVRRIELVSESGALGTIRCAWSH